MLMDALNVVPIPRGELLVYSGDTAPVPLWAAEGAALVDNTTPTVGRVEAGPRPSRRCMSSVRPWPRPAGRRPRWSSCAGSIRSCTKSGSAPPWWATGPWTGPAASSVTRASILIDYGAALTQAHIRAVRDRLRTQKGTGEDPLWILSEAWASAGIVGGWLSETGSHSGVMSYRTPAATGSRTSSVQGLTTVAKTIGLHAAGGRRERRRPGGPGGQDALAKGLAPRRSRL